MDNWLKSDATVLSPRYTVSQLSEEAQAHAYEDWCVRNTSAHGLRHDAPMEVFLVDCAANGSLFTEMGYFVYSETQRTNLLLNSST